MPVAVAQLADTLDRRESSGPRRPRESVYAVPSRNGSTAGKSHSRSGLSRQPAGRSHDLTQRLPAHLRVNHTSRSASLPSLAAESARYHSYTRDTAHTHGPIKLPLTPPRGFLHDHQIFISSVSHAPIFWAAALDAPPAA